MLICGLLCKILGMRQTTTKDLIEAKLGGRSVDALVAMHRRKGASWQTIADDIRTRTGVIVSRETIRSWYTPRPARHPAA